VRRKPAEVAREHDDAAGNGGRAAYACFFVANYVPWSAAEPPLLDYASWEKQKRGWVAAADPTPPHGDGTEVAVGVLDHK
jgi:hypothetical protein